jgi:hypothetical protein
MKKQKFLFNEALRRYNRYLRKLDKLAITGRNVYRNDVPSLHPLRLKGKLESLYISIKGVAAIVAVSAICMLTALETNAQISFATRLSLLLIVISLVSSNEFYIPFSQ